MSILSIQSFTSISIDARRALPYQPQVIAPRSSIKIAQAQFNPLARYRLSGILLALAAMTLLLNAPASFAQTATPSPTPAPIFSLSPNKIQKGKEFDLFLTAQPEGIIARIQRVVAANGSGVEISKTELTADRKQLRIPIKTAADAESGATKLLIYIEGNPQPYIVELTMTSASPLERQATPNDITEVDGMWMVLPRRIARDNFGGRISDNYFCIEVVLGNNTGYALELSTIGFKLTDTNGGGERVMLPSTSRRVVVASITRSNEAGTRPTLVKILTNTGALASAFIPFFKVPTHSSNYSTLTSIFGNQFITGFEQSLPNLTLSQLRRLDEDIMRDTLTIPNNEQRRTIIFMPKNLLLPKRTDGKRTDGKGKSDKNPEQEQEILYEVMQRLGDMVLVGKLLPMSQIQNRQIVIARQQPAPLGALGAPFGAGNGDNRSVAPGTGATPFTPIPVVSAVSYPDGVIPKSNAQSEQKVRISLTGQNLDVATADKIEINFPGEAGKVPQVESIVEVSSREIVLRIVLPKGLTANTYKLQVKYPDNDRLHTVDFTVLPQQ